MKFFFLDGWDLVPQFILLLVVIVVSLVGKATGTLELPKRREPPTELRIVKGAAFAVHVILGLVAIAAIVMIAFAILDFVTSLPGGSPG